MAPLNILVVGTGIAGPAFASFLLLSNLKTNITLLERAPTVRPEGQNIDLRTVGIDCVRRLRLEKSIRAHLTGEKGVHWVDKQDRAIASIPASKPGETQGPTTDIELLRGTLARLIVEQCEKLSQQSKESGSGRVDFIYNDYIEELQQEGSSVRVRFANSKVQRTFDIIVGADGLQSRTRRQAFGVEGEARRLHKLGIYGAFFSIPRGASDSEWRRWYHAPDQRGVMLRPSDRPNRMTVFMHKKSEDSRFTDVATGARDVTAQKALIMETFSDMGWQSERLLDELDRSEDFYYDMIAQVKMDQWSKGRVVLIGDAAHCATPLSGMGTSLALSGGYNLAGALVQHPEDIPAAFAQYEEAQRLVVEPAQALSPVLISLAFSAVAPWQVWLANYFAACVAFVMIYSAPISGLVFLLAGSGKKAPVLREYGFRVPPEEF